MEARRLFYQNVQGGSIALVITRSNSLVDRSKPISDQQL
jgi:hypothetical protein